MRGVIQSIIIFQNLAPDPMSVQCFYVQQHTHDAYTLRRIILCNYFIYSLLFIHNAAQQNNDDNDESKLNCITLWTIVWSTDNSVCRCGWFVFIHTQKFSVLIRRILFLKWTWRSNCLNHLKIYEFQLFIVWNKTKYSDEMHCVFGAYCFGIVHAN